MASCRFPVFSGLFLLFITPLTAGTDCPSGWTPSKTIEGKCLYLEGDHLEDRWENVTRWCSQLDPLSTPITIRNAFENRETFEYALQHQQLVWLGMAWNGSSFQWNMTYTNWHSGQPDYHYAVTFWENAFAQGDGTWSSLATSIGLMRVLCQLYV